MIMKCNLNPDQKEMQLELLPGINDSHPSRGYECSKIQNVIDHHQSVSICLLLELVKFYSILTLYFPCQTIC